MVYTPYPEPARWLVLLHDAFVSDLMSLAVPLQDELLAHARLLERFGPRLGRPAVDTLKGSRHASMKELRFGWRGEVWRVAFSFDPMRHAVLLAAGDKAGVPTRRFYRSLIRLADTRFDGHLATLHEERYRHGKNT